MKAAPSLVVLLLLLSESLRAQWPISRSPGIPRAADGSPDLSAPAPKAPDGNPDLSGIWVLRPTIDPGLIGSPYGREFVDIGAYLDDGLPFQPWAADQVASTRTDFRAKDPLSHCLPIGVVRSHTHPGYKEFVQLPDKLILLNELNSSFRLIFTDGRPLPVNPVPTINGYSAGRWEGDTLVVETTGFRADSIWLDNSGSPLTDAGRITEKFRRVNFGEIQIELTVDDPKAYTRPWTVTLTQNLVADSALIESFCAEEALEALTQVAAG